MAQVLQAEILFRYDKKRYFPGIIGRYIVQVLQAEILSTAGPRAKVFNADTVRHGTHVKICFL
jgi:hypothetical protein